MGTTLRLDRSLRAKSWERQRVDRMAQKKERQAEDRVAATLFVFNDDGTVEFLPHCIHSIPMLIQQLDSKLAQKIA